MEKIKTILDRKPLSSEYIRSKQDFANVVKGAKGLGKPYWQTNWFIGTVGVAAVAIIVTAVTLSSSEDPKKPDHNQVITAMNAESQPEVPSMVSGDLAQIEETSDDVNIELEEETIAVENDQNVPSDRQETQTVSSNNREEEIPSTTVARELPLKVEEPETVELGLPNVAGVTGGPIAFKDFCDPLGIQVDGGVIIHRYTLQYRSCARDITVRIGGNRLPPEVCQEIADCGAPIEVTFSNFKAEDRSGNAVKLKSFSLVTVP